ncbi:expressed unknown protein [Seminavis robusta]|uniref:Uncharacterized protein n=1 Tax=Seminavis robusta TaxID=568900 RepID=A0A9N8F5H2_9STRA|nr:expressed unknown protein [Seminavis robusta]|eukprot:Sro3406_g347660.1 n/a (295) ;mRNA; r:1795-2679
MSETDSSDESSEGTNEEDCATISSDEGTGISNDSVEATATSLDTSHATLVLRWTQQIPIRLGLCPWAMKSQSLRRLRCTTCLATSPADVAKQVISEVEMLCPQYGLDSGTDLAWSTTLVVCPFVDAWNAEFGAFDGFVRSLSRDLQSLSLCDYDDPARSYELLQEVTLVAFHPRFLRWRALPACVDIGSTVQSHKGMGGFRKSTETFPATIIDTTTPVFGRRKIKIRFHHDSKEQYVPIDWIVFEQDQLLGEPLPDNAMHRAPYPTVHLIRNQDLASLCVRSVSLESRGKTLFA